MADGTGPADAVSVTTSGELVFLERIGDLAKLSSGQSYPPPFIETRLRWSVHRGHHDAWRRVAGLHQALINIGMGVVSRWAGERGWHYFDIRQTSRK